MGSLGLNDPRIASAARIVLEESGSPPALRRIATDFLHPKIETNVKEEFSKFDRGDFQIQYLRTQLKSYPRNSVVHVEIARAYCTNGLTDRANEHFRIALQLAPNSRYVLRSAARFDVHRGDVYRSWKCLEKVAEHDPWIAAAYITIGDMAELPLDKLRRIRGLLYEGANPAQTSELAAALATFELKSSGPKKARKHLQLCAIDPNENVVAQLYWLSRTYSDRPCCGRCRNHCVGRAASQQASEASSTP